MNNKVKTEQAALLLALIIPAGKMAKLPIVMARSAGRDYWISMLILFLLDYICLLFILWALKINKEGKSLNEVLVDSVGKVVSKIVFIVFFVFFLLSAMSKMEACMRLMTDTFTMKANWVAYTLPVLGVMFFIVRKGMNNIARLSEMLFVVIGLAILWIAIFAAKDADFSNLKPILDDGLGPVAKTAFNGTLWFSDYLFLLFIMDKFRPNKNAFATMSLGFGAGAGITVFINVIYIGLFGQLTTMADSMISKVSQFSISMTSNGRLDWLAVSIWVLAFFIKVAVNFFCGYKCLSYIFGLGESKFHNWVPAVMFLPVVVVPLFIPAGDLILNKMNADFHSAVFWPVQFLLPLLLPLLVYVATRKEKAKTVYPKEHKT